MKKLIMAAAVLWPLAVFGAGWNYYTLNEDGSWEPVSPRDLDLSSPGPGPQQRVMILYNRPKPERRRVRETQSWIPQITSDLVKEVE